MWAAVLYWQAVDQAADPDDGAPSKGSSAGRAPDQDEANDTQNAAKTSNQARQAGADRAGAGGLGWACAWFNEATLCG
jgi:hypothetical protein